ncbi:MAG: DUF3048 domain-containing protein [bacterium]|nr:DUF3048 domain-containing protein [bacterium]
MNEEDQPINIGPDGLPTPLAPPSEPLPTPKGKRRMMPAFWYRWNRKTKILSTAALVLVLSAASLAVYTNFINNSHGSTGTNKSAAKADNRVASPLTGVKVDPELAKRPVTGIMIENSQDARPQSGIQDAGVIFEAIAEGGITRFITLYQDATPQYIGPVRSLRPYYIDWATAFDAGIVHIGGSPEALAQIRGGGKDLDQFFNAGSFWRESSRPAPHDVYTSFAKLDALNKSKGYTSSTFTSWARKADLKLATPSAKSIDMNISSAVFNVHYDYDAISNSYHRSEGGAPHIATSSAGDKTGTLLAPKVVVAMIMSYSIVDRSGHSGYGVNAGGAVYIFQDGGVTVGTWSKAGRTSQIIFKDSASQEVKLNTGQTWVTALQNGQLHYSP